MFWDSEMLGEKLENSPSGQPPTRPWAPAVQAWSWRKLQVARGLAQHVAGAWGSGQGWHPVFLDDVGRVFTAWGLPAIAPTLSGETAWREALEGFWREVISLPRASVSPPTPFLGKQPLGGRSHAQLDWEVLCSDLPSLAAPPV